MSSSLLSWVPVGTGMSVSGGRNDTVMDNTFSHSDAWGVILVPFLDSGKPCDGGVFGGALGPQSCLWDDYGDALIGNTFSDNGSFGHPTNGDFAEVNVLTDPGSDCYRANHRPGGGAVQPTGAAAMQRAMPRCATTTTQSGSSDSRFLGEVLCDSQVQIVPGTPASCPTGGYPRVTKIVMHPLPKSLRSMPDPRVPGCPPTRGASLARPSGRAAERPSGRAAERRAVRAEGGGLGRLSASEAYLLPQAAVDGL